MAWLYKQNGSQNWWIGWRAGGRQFLRSTNTADKKEAEKQLATYNTVDNANRAGKLTEEFIRTITGRTSADVTLKAALKSWLDETERSAAAGTLSRYQRLATALEVHLNATETTPLLRDVTTAHLRTFLGGRSKLIATGTLNLERKILRIFFMRAVREGELTINPMLQVKRFAHTGEEREERRAYTLKEVLLLYSKTKDDFWRWMILAGFYTGQRMGDLICITAGAFDFQANVIRLTSRKTRKQVQIPMSTSLRFFVDRLKATSWPARPAGFVWPEQARRYQSKSGAGSFSNEFREDILAAAGLVKAREDKQGHKAGRGVRRKGSDVSFHSLRHTFVSLLKATGGNQAVAKSLVGHSSDQVNDSYTHLPIETLATAIAALPEVKG